MLRQQSVQRHHNEDDGCARFAAGGSYTSRDENHVHDDYLGTVCDQLSSVSSITNDCVPIPYPQHGKGGGLVGHTYSYHGDEECFRSYSTPLPGGEEDAICAAYQANVKQTRSHQHHDDEQSSDNNGHFNYPNVITIIPIANPISRRAGAGAAPIPTKISEGGVKDRRLPWYYISNQSHFKTHPIADPTVSSTPPMTPERNSLCTNNARKQRQTTVSDSLAVEVAVGPEGAVIVPSLSPTSNQPFPQSENGRLVEMASFDGGSDVDSDSQGYTIGNTISSTHSVAGFGAFVYRKVKDSSRRTKLLLGLIAIATATAFSAAVVGLLETTTASHSDRIVTPTFLPEHDSAEHSPNIGPTPAPSSTTGNNVFIPSSSVVGSKNVTLLPTNVKSFPSSTKYPSLAVVSQQLIETTTNHTSAFSREPTHSTSITPSTHRPTQQNTSRSPIVQNTTRRPTPHPTGKPSSSLPTSRPTTQPTRKPSFEPTLSPISEEPTADPSMRSPPPSPIDGGPPTVFPSRYS